ncbi:hypothetical protein [Fictibacillus terranigra]|uniref:hypothetical protein n=1 Tax=Fictibacillus terranigra TaxID=3058424 RepID=UPI00338FA1F7
MVEYGITHWRQPKNREYVAKRYEKSAARIFNALIQKGANRGEFKPMAPVYVQLSGWGRHFRD